MCILHHFWLRSHATVVEIDDIGAYGVRLPDPSPKIFIIRCACAAKLFHQVKLMLCLFRKHGIGKSDESQCGQKFSPFHVVGYILNVKIYGQYVLLHSIHSSTRAGS